MIRLYVLFYSIFNYLKKLFIKMSNEIYQVKSANVVCIICFISLLYFLNYISINFFGICCITSHLESQFDLIGYFGLILAFLLPLAFLGSENFLNKNYINSIVFLKATLFFPIIIYFCMSLVFLGLFNKTNLNLFNLLCLNLLTIFMYYRTLKLFIDKPYRNQFENEVKKDLFIDYVKNFFEYLNYDHQIEDYSNSGFIDYSFKNRLNGFEKYEKYENSKKLKNYFIIGYNFQKIKLINKHLLKINKGKTNSKNVYIYIRKVNDNFIYDECLFELYYKNDFKDNVDLIKIKKLLNQKVYKLIKTDFEFYLCEYYESIYIKAFEFINGNLDLSFKKSMNEASDFYNNLDSVMKKNLGDVGCSDVREIEKFLYKLEAFKFHDLIIEKYISVLNSIIYTNKSDVMFIYLRSNINKSIYNSLRNSAIISAYQFINLYKYIVSIMLEKQVFFSDFHYLRAKYFEIIKIVFYEYLVNKSDVEYLILIILNKTYVDICLDIFTKKDDILIEFLNEFKFQEWFEEININDGENKNILMEYETNLFVNMAYMYFNSSNRKGLLINYYKEYNLSYLTLILDNIFYKYNNDNNYNWDLVFHKIELENNDDESNLDTLDIIIDFFSVVSHFCVFNSYLPICENLLIYKVNILLRLDDKIKLAFEDMFKKVKNID